ncbi:hypothetical protein [Nostoc sp. PCC 9305]|uniref:hypothetical protein n=1 Tax=Nostoc sp. PCC 9305 TaxID=296636 RepID=UPI0039C683B9
MLQKRKEAVKNLCNAYELLHDVYISGDKDKLSEDTTVFKDSIQKSTNQIKEHIAEICLVDGIILKDSKGNFDWSKVNQYIE